MNKHLKAGRKVGWFAGAFERWERPIPKRLTEKQRHGLLGSMFKLHDQFSREEERIEALTPVPLRNPASDELGAEKLASARSGGDFASFADVLRAAHLPTLAAEPEQPAPATAEPAVPEPRNTPRGSDQRPDDFPVPEPDPLHKAMKPLSGKETPEQRRARIAAQISGRQPVEEPSSSAAHRAAMIEKYRTRPRKR